MFDYFAYGSNMNAISLRAKGVVPRRSERALLRGYELRFNVAHWFRHEGGVGNICPTDRPGAVVRGVVHRIDDEDLARLDAMEAYGWGYDRMEVALETASGPRRAIAYVGIPRHMDPSCLPTRRYLNILVDGAVAAGLDPAYIEALRAHPVHRPPDYPPFVHPEGEHPRFTAATLAEHPKYTALLDAVFDMAHARWEHRYLWRLFGGRDTTLFHLKRLDTADGTESIEDIEQDRLRPEQRHYLNICLHEYNAEYRYVGRFVRG